MDETGGQITNTPFIGHVSKMQPNCSGKVSDDYRQTSSSLRYGVAVKL